MNAHDMQSLLWGRCKAVRDDKCCLKVPGAKPPNMHVLQEMVKSLHGGMAGPVRPPGVCSRRRERIGFFRISKWVICR